MSKIIYILLLAITVLSCKRRPLSYDYYPYADLTILIDWSEAFEVEDKPTGVSVWFYPTDGGEPIQTHSANVDKHLVSLAEGTYDVVVFNQTPAELSGTIGFRGVDDISTLEVYSIPMTTSREPGNGRGMLTREPEQFAVTVYRGLEVTEEMVEDTRYSKYHQESSTTNRTVEVTPLLANKLHKVRVRIVGFQNLSPNGVYGELSGLAEGYLIGSGTPNTTNARQQLAGWEQTLYPGEYSKGEVTVEYITWGLMSDPNGHTVGQYDYWLGLLELAFKLVDNETTVYFDVNLNKNNLTIIEGEEGAVTTLEIIIDVGFEPGGEIILPDVEPAEGESSGFKPNVNPWDEQDVPIVIG